MTQLTLQVVLLDAVAPLQVIACAFAGSGGTIGRDDTNAMALPDKHRRVSRLHATVSFPGGVPTITNSSTSLPISVGEQQVDSGDSVPISHGMLIEIGPYVLQAQLGGAAAMPAMAAPAPAANVTFMPQFVAPVAPPVAPPVVPPAQTAAMRATPAFVASTAPVQSPVVAPGAPALDIGSLFPEARGADSFITDLIPPAAAPLVPHAPVAAPSPMSAASHIPSDALFAPPPAAAPTAASAGVFTIAPGTPGNADPFADLLAGIGTPAPQPISAPIYAAPAPLAPHTPLTPLTGSAGNGLSVDPLAGLGGGLLPSGGFTPAAAPSQMGGGAGTVIPDDFNLFQLPSDTSRNSADPLSSLLGTANTVAASQPAGDHPAPSIDSLFYEPGPAQTGAGLFGSPADSGAPDGTLDSLIRSHGASDPLALFDAAPQPSAQRAMRDDSLEIGSAFVPPTPLLAGERPASPPQSALIPDDASFNLLAPPPAVAAPLVASALPVAPTHSVAPPPTYPAAPVAASPLPPAASPDALTDAFLRGAGLAPSALPHGLTPEIMTIVGSLLRSATAGAVDMLAARAATKREVQASVTIISVQANNPLKFLPNADAALLQLLGKKMPGFMRADVAMRDAFDDLRAHEVGVIAGTRAALTEVLGKFDPAVLGDKLARGSVLESLMPSARKAKLWDQYLERYLQIRREAEDDFQSIFGRAFVQAYERETARIKGESPATGGNRS